MATEVIRAQAEQEEQRIWAQFFERRGAGRRSPVSALS
jgi:hypothetical protein